MTNLDPIQPLDAVALASDIPTLGLFRGQVGTVVEVFDSAFEVEFVDSDGHTYAVETFSAEQLILLRYKPARVA